MLVNHTQSLYRGRVFGLVRENITLDNGVTLDIDIIRHPGASAIVPILENGNLVLIRQYRHAVGGYIWEIPAGTLGKDELPLECAKRELCEETGYTARQWESLGSIVPVPGYSDERIHLFMAKGLEPVQQNLDSDEVLRVHEIPLKEVIRMSYEGEITDSKTLSGLFRALERLAPIFNPL